MKSLTLSYDVESWKLYQKEILHDENWKDFSSVKRWKNRLSVEAKLGELSDATWEACEFWMPRFLIFAQKTPDQLIEDAIADPEEGENQIFGFYNWLIKSENTGISSAHMAAHGRIRGFYTKNKVNTSGWHTPAAPPSEVAQTDANYPLFVVVDKDGKKSLDLNRDIFHDFFARLNYRDQIIALAAISSGEDIGDILKKTLGWLRSQNNADRLFDSNYRNKNGEIINTFWSREATSRVRHYEKTERKDAADNEPIFVTTMIERKKQFTKKHQREYSIDDMHDLPLATIITVESIAVNFRNAQIQMGIKLEKNKQSPLRPKRLRHVFRQACQHAAIGKDMTDIFQGRKGTSSKKYEPKSREELEVYYEMVEPFVTIYADNKDGLLEKIKEETSSTVGILKNQIENLQDQIKRKDDMAVNAIMELRKELDEIRQKKS